MSDDILCDSEKPKRNEMDVAVSHLKYLRDTAISFLGRPITGSVLTYPCNFSADQLEAFKRAAESAELDPLQFIKEPIAQILAIHELRLLERKDSIIMVIDIGGIRSDITFVRLRQGYFTILSSFSGEIGGTQIDDIMFEYVASAFKKTHSIDVKTDDRAQRKLKVHAADIKNSLGASNSMRLSIDSLSNGIDFSLNISNIRFEILLKPFIAELEAFVTESLFKSNLDEIQVEQLIFAGGISNIKKVRNKLSSNFPAAEIQSSQGVASSVDLSELSALGAALQGSLIKGFDPKYLESIVTPDVLKCSQLSMALGYSLSDNKFNEIIKQGTPVPCRVCCSIDVPSFPQSGEENNQNKIELKFAEGVENVHTIEYVQNEEDCDDERQHELITRKENRLVKKKELAKVEISPASHEIMVDVDQKGKLQITLKPSNGVRGEIVKMRI